MGLAARYRLIGLDTSITLAVRVIHRVMNLEYIDLPEPLAPDISD